MEIQLRNISKKYSKKEVLKHINLSVENSQIYCLLGRNGTGKSTIINLLSNLIEPSEGGVYINGDLFDYTRLDFKKKIGLLSQYDQILEELNTDDFLEMVGLIYNLKKDILASRKKLLVDYFFDDADETNKIIKTYSNGMKKKVALCATFLHNPHIILLDEPFTHLDIPGCKKLCTLIQSYVNHNQERMVFICSHDLQHVEKIATHIGIIENAQLVYNSTIEEFKKIKENIELSFLSYIKESSKNHSFIAEELSK